MAVDELGVDELFGVPLDRFLGAREALAKKLKASGATQDAARVTALRKPTVAAWAVNQLARRHPDEVEELLAAGRALGRAQRAAASRRSREDWQARAVERRRVVDQLVRRAAALLSEAGHPASRTALDRVADTLMATAGDDEAATMVRAGTLIKEIPAPAGFGGLLQGDSEPEDEGVGAPGGAAARRRGSSTRNQARGRERAAEKAEAEAARRRDAAAEADRAVTRARAEVERAERAAREAAHRLVVAERRAEKARQVARDAAGAAAKARGAATRRRP